MADSGILKFIDQVQFVLPRGPKTVQHLNSYISYKKLVFCMICTDFEPFKQVYRKVGLKKHNWQMIRLK